MAAEKLRTIIRKLKNKALGMECMFDPYISVLYLLVNVNKFPSGYPLLRRLMVG